MKVLISTGYGAGWSTWNGHCTEMATDKDLIEFFESGCTKRQMKKLIKEKGILSKDYGGVPYVGGFDGLRVEEVPKGSLFKIREYDGKEYIEIFDPDEWLMAED